MKEPTYTTKKAPILSFDGLKSGIFHAFAQECLSYSD